jgi:ribulose bisphosphate carboxylase small subunit
MSYYIAPRFLDKLSVHLAKNFLDLPNVKVPLILGIHGRKGEGKTFMCELVFKRMGIGVVYMSAGELESPDAGDPSRLIRLRYREAGEWSRVNGRMAALMINDVDAGIGRVDETTQYTVNTQLVNATLMNIADHPTNVQLPGSYNQEPTRRIPIILTGNDFSTMYAPLIRDGRMEKFYWEPDTADRRGIVIGIFAADQVPASEVEKLVQQFPDQSIDFFGALRARLYDEQVRKLIQDVGLERISPRIVNSAEPLPEFRRPDFSLEHLVEVGQAMVREQQRIRELRLADEYNRAGMVQRPHPQIPVVTPPLSSSPLASAPASTAPPPETLPGTGNGHAGLPAAATEAVLGLIRQGKRVGLEVANPRHYRANTWQCYQTLEGSESEALATLANCLQEHSRDYVRVVGIDPQGRRRLAETIIQRP